MLIQIRSVCSKLHLYSDVMVIFVLFVIFLIPSILLALTAVEHFRICKAFV